MINPILTESSVGDVQKLVIHKSNEAHHKDIRKTSQNDTIQCQS